MTFFIEFDTFRKDNNAMGLFVACIRRCKMEKIILTGDRPTGRLHVGHYVGSLKRRVELQNSGEFDKIYIMIADAQALTDNAEHPEKVRQNIVQVALDYLACGIDPEKSTTKIINTKNGRSIKINFAKIKIEDEWTKVSV